MARDVRGVRHCYVRLRCGIPRFWGVSSCERWSTTAFVVPTVATSVDLVVHLALDVSAHRRVREILGVSGRIEGDVIETTELFTTRLGHLERSDGYPPHPERYEMAGLDLLGALCRHPERGLQPALLEA